jgi:GTPase SAR1 family protein
LSSLIFLDHTSFESIPKWIADAKEARGNDVKFVLVGNKSDIEDKR